MTKPLQGSKLRSFKKAIFGVLEFEDNIEDRLQSSNIVVII